MSAEEVVPSPRQWGAWRKNICIVICIWSSIVASYSTSAYISAVTDIQQELGVTKIVVLLGFPAFTLGNINSLLRF